MKPTTLARNGVSAPTVELISRLVESIPWPDRRHAMGDVTASGSFLPGNTGRRSGSYLIGKAAIPNLPLPRIDLGAGLA
ncbi:MAG: hypothetical protein ABJA84_08260, partial [Polaromonas sp.]